MTTQRRWARAERQADGQSVLLLAGKAGRARDRRTELRSHGGGPLAGHPIARQVDARRMVSRPLAPVTQRTAGQSIRDPPHLLIPRGMCRRVDEWTGGRGTSTLTSPRSEEHTSELQSLMRISYA